MYDTTPPLPMTRAARCPFDPPAEFTQLQSDQPVHRMRTPEGDLVWVISRYNDIRTVLTDRRFSADSRNPGYPAYPQGNAAPPPGVFIQMDRTEQARLRRMVTKYFIGPRLEQTRPVMQQIATDVVKRLLEHETPVDFVRAAALPMAMRMICHVLGVPYDEHVFVQRQADTILRLRPDADQVDPGQAVAELMAYLDRIITAKLDRPRDDLLSELVSNQLRTGELSRDELVGMGTMLLLNGYNPTAMAIALGTALFLLHPDQRTRFLTDPDSTVGAIDELMRYLSVLHGGTPRVAVADVEIGGQLIRAGEAVLGMLSVGNRDETAFPDPDVFDIDRSARNHLAFGHGVHKCIGNSYTQVQLDVVFRTLFEKIPTLSLVEPVDKLTFNYQALVYGMVELPVTW